MKFKKTDKSKKGIFLSFFLVALLLGQAILFVSCGSTKVDKGPAFVPVEDFTTKNLGNGIPVIFKQNRGSKIVVLRIVFEGGLSAIDKSISGIEGITLDLALRGSENYPYKTISQLEYEKSFSLNSSSGKDFALAGFTCIQRDMSEVLDIFAECMLNPLFSESDFNQRITEVKSEIASRKADPSGALSIALSEEAFKNHPYETTSSANEESVNNITLSLVKGIHQGLLNALRMKIVVVGNFNASLLDDFTAALDKKFGSVPRKAFSAPKIPKISVGNTVVRVANEQAGNTGYIAGLFECPNKTAPDYIPFALATMYLDDLLYSQVREKAGAVYSINTGIIGGKELVGVLSVYKATEKAKLKKLITDAILSVDEKKLNDDLDSYKNKFITSLFSSGQTATGLASSLISSMVYLGSEKAYLERADLVQSVQTSQVISAYNKYILPIAKENAACWILVDGEENINEYDF